LERLRLDNNHLKSIPKKITKLTNLQSLDLRGNNLKEIPKEIRGMANLSSKIETIKQ
jgi:Leucine-rich repeat (LRR) protein